MIGVSQDAARGRAELQARRPLGPAARLIAPLFLVVGGLFATTAPSAGGTGGERVALLGFAACTDSDSAA